MWFHHIEVTVGHVPTGVERVPLELPLDVSKKVVRLADVMQRSLGARAHSCPDAVKVRASQWRGWLVGRLDSQASSPA